VLHGRKELWAKVLKISSILQEFDAGEGVGDQLDKTGEK
jgi:hypothetical protein